MGQNRRQDPENVSPKKIKKFDMGQRFSPITKVLMVMTLTLMSITLLSLFFMGLMVFSRVPCALAQWSAEDSAVAYAQNKERYIINPPGPDEALPTQPEVEDAPDKSNPPTEIKKLSDLQGCWVSDPDFVLKANNSKYFYYYCFNKLGQAKSYSARYDARGRVTKECHFDSSAKLAKKGFVLTEGPCPGWTQGVFDCALKAPGQVNCDLNVNKKNYPIDLHYQGNAVPETGSSKQ